VPGSLTDLAGFKVKAAGFLAVIMETIGQPVWVVDPNAAIRFANPGRDRGYSPARPAAAPPSWWCFRSPRTGEPPTDQTDRNTVREELQRRRTWPMTQRSRSSAMSERRPPSAESSPWSPIVIGPSTEGRLVRAA